MAALDFPNSPTVGQQYSAPNGAVYTWDGAAWTVSGVISTGTVAGGDLTGTYPNPTVAANAIGNAEISDVAWTKVTGAPSAFPPSGTAAGDLSGTYPNPTVTATAKSKWTDTGTVLTPTPSGYANKLTLDTAGILAVGPGTVKASLVAASDSSLCTVRMNDPYGPQDATRSSWALAGYTATSAEVFSILRRAPGAGAGVTSTVLALDGPGTLTIGGPMLTTGARTAAWQGMRVTGTDAGVRCQNVGNNAGVGDGYGEAIAFGYGSALVARVNSTQLGSVNVTPPSDARYKTDVQEDVPGLDAVCALRPVTFQYDHTARELLPPGRHYGLIAQEAEPHVPLAIEDDGSAEHYLALDYRPLVPVLIRAIQELTTRVAALEARLVTPSPTNA